MKLKDTLFGKEILYASLAEYAEAKLDGNDYGVGTLEAAAYTAENNSKAIGRLLDYLADKGKIDVETVNFIVGDVQDNIEFIEE